MATTTTKINKPLNPRGNDASPLAYNKAAIYSGKALDFDGVNDYVDLDGFTLSGTTATFVFNLNLDAISINQFVFDLKPMRFVLGLSDIIGNPFSLYDNAQWQSFGDLEAVQWHNISVVVNGTNAKMYLNGQSFGNEITMANAIDFDSATDVSFGSNFSKAGGFLNGQLTNTKIFDVALTAAQIADLYNNPEKIVPTGVDDTALKLWLPMMEGAGTTAYNGAPDALGSNVVTNGNFDTDLTGWSTNDFSNGSIVQSSGTALITSNGGLGYPSIWQQVTTIVGERYIVKSNFSNNTTGAWLWKNDDNSPLGGTNRVPFLNNDTSSSINAIFEFTATATLSSISAFAEQADAGSFNLDSVEVLQMSNIGTISGATYVNGIGAPVAQTAVIDWNKHTLDGTNAVLIPQGLTSGRDLLGNLFENVRKQGALNLDGNSWAEVHDNESLDITDAITLEAWVWYLEGDTDWAAISKYQSSNDAFMMFFYPAGSVQFFADGSQKAATNPDALTNNDWNHVVITYDRANVRIYINGSEDNSSVYTPALKTTSKVLEIGRYWGSSTYATEGSKIAQPRIYNRALTAEEVQRNYDAGKNTYTN